MNQVNLIGNLTKDVELRYTTDQKAIAKFTLAINDGYGENQRTSFIPIVVFGKQAENAERFLSKGSKAGITGRIQTGSYTNQEGVKIYTTDVIANSVEFLDSRPTNEPQRGYEQQGFTALREDDVPWRG